MQAPGGPSQTPGCPRPRLLLLPPAAQPLLCMGAPETDRGSSHCSCPCPGGPGRGHHQAWTPPTQRTQGQPVTRPYLQHIECCLHPALLSLQACGDTGWKGGGTATFSSCPGPGTPPPATGPIQPPNPPPRWRRGLASRTGSRAVRPTARALPGPHCSLPPACAPVWSCRPLMECLPSRQLLLPGTLTAQGEG